MSGYSRRSKFQGEKRISINLTRDLKIKNLILVTSSRRKSSCLQEDSRNSLTFLLDTYRFLMVSEDFRPIWKRIFAQVSIVKSMKPGPRHALHSIIRILPTTYWTWSNADENHIIKREEKTAYYVVTAEVMTQWFFEILAGWSDNVLPASRTFLPAETAKYHQLSWWTVKAFMVPCFGSNLHMVWVNPRWRYFCSVAYKLTHGWRRRKY